MTPLQPLVAQCKSKTKSKSKNKSNDSGQSRIKILQVVVSEHGNNNSNNSSIGRLLQTFEPMTGNMSWSCKFKWCSLLSTGMLFIEHGQWTRCAWVASLAHDQHELEATTTCGAKTYHLASLLVCCEFTLQAANKPKVSLCLRQTVVWPPLDVQPSQVNGGAQFIGSWHWFASANKCFLSACRVARWLNGSSLAHWNSNSQLRTWSSTSHQDTRKKVKLKSSTEWR